MGPQQKRNNGKREKSGTRSNVEHKSAHKTAPCPALVLTVRKLRLLVFSSVSRALLNHNRWSSSRGRGNHQWKVPCSWYVWNWSLNNRRESWESDTSRQLVFSVLMIHLSLSLSFLLLHLSNLSCIWIASRNSHLKYDYWWADNAGVSLFHSRFVFIASHKTLHIYIDI